MNSNRMDALKKGTLLHDGKYVIEGILGRGGFGITYLAIEKATGTKVAIKEFFFKEYCQRDTESNDVTVPTLSKKGFVSKFEKKFLKEAQMLTTLDHPHIVKVLDVFQENNTSYFVMEHVDGQPLSRILAPKATMPENEAVGIITKIGQALSYLHERSINHLDIKPGNIMLDKNNRVLLIDFGVSKHYDPESGDGTTTTPVGISHGYSPIEQYSRGGVGNFSPQSDIYALGATLYRLLTGVKPPSAIELSQNSITIPPTISKPIAKAIEAAMQPKKIDRPATMDDFLKMLNEDAENEEATVLMPPDEDEDTVLDDSDEGQKGRFFKWVYAIGIGLAFLACVFFIIHCVRFPDGKAPKPIPDNADSDSVAVRIEPAKMVAEMSDTIVTKVFNDNVTSPDGIPRVVYFETPVSGGNIALLQNIREWINERLGGNYEGDIADGPAMLKFYINNGTEQEIRITKQYDNDHLVTFVSYSNNDGQGNALGKSRELGTTFRKSDGKTFAKEMIAATEGVRNLLKNRLKEHFQLSSDDDLLMYVTMEPGQNAVSVPLPKANPWITQQGVVFSYGESEITLNGMGQTSFVIPVDSIMKFLSPTGKSFFQPKPMP